MIKASAIKISGQSKTPDERVGLLVFVSYVLWLLLLNDLRALAVVVGAMVLLLVYVSPAPGAVLGRWARGLPAAALVVVLFWSFAPAEAQSWFTLLGKSFGPWGLWQGTFFAARFMGFLLGGLYVYETSTPEQTARAALWFAAPLRLLRLPIHLLYYIIWFAMRSIPLLAQEALIVGLAQRARGARLTGGRRWWSPDALALIIPVFAAAARRSDRFATALEARGFSPVEHYRIRSPRLFAARDGLWAVGLAIAWAVFGCWRWGGM